MPVSTDHLAEDVKELRESNQRLAEAIRDLGRDLGNFRVDVAERLGAINTNIRVEVAEKLGAIDTNIRVEVAEKLGAINANLEAFRARTETSLRVAIWGFAILTPVVISLIGGAFWVTWHAAKLDSRVERVESVLKKDLATVPARQVR
jgi:hypothetical protein